MNQSNLGKRILSVCSDDIQRKKFRGDLFHDNISYNQSDENQPIWQFEESKLRNLLVYLNHLDDWSFYGHEGRYVVIKNGEMWPFSFANIDDANENVVKLGDPETTQIYFVPP